LFLIKKLDEYKSIELKRERILISPFRGWGIKMASYLYRTAQPFTLAIFQSWGSSTGAGRIRLAAANINKKPHHLTSSPKERRQHSCTMLNIISSHIML